MSRKTTNNDRVFVALFSLAIVCTVASIWDDAAWVTILWAVSLLSAVLVRVFNPFRN